eukprot:CAMPEP_0195517966 /NCGR_PEP_ID=MMETSP0794_2-20130614/11849_1 /TAXON_ID=515487 /ORGANISM="Stephanopyxis turris, Strain CCMP 815" /LENGTH=286 /DNA_ID=CAMNT_0040646853 /DNA_START=57 /DNA_END=917 /DNA_ORIENTATION=+
MTDDRLRCALIYRLDRNLADANITSTIGGTENEASGNGITLSSIPTKAAVILLAKYDHASQYESHGGCDEGTLYGGRDKNYADAVAMVIGNDPPIVSADSNSLGGFKVVQSEVHQVVYGVDTDGLCMGVITGLKYPSRVAIQMIIELHGEFTEKCGVQAKSGTINSLSRKSKPIMSSICTKYDDLSSVDKTSAILGKVDEVKTSMQGNIAAMLANTEQADSLAQQSDQLNIQAEVFKEKSTDLKKQMKCKNLKLTIILIFVVVGILAVIFLPIMLKFKNAAKSDNP